jgi:hypothetical protein
VNSRSHRQDRHFLSHGSRNESPVRPCTSVASQNACR